LSLDPQAGAGHKLIGPFTDAERVAVERAIVRCHVLAHLPPARADRLARVSGGRGTFRGRGGTA
jgi:hypothetical protein